MQPFDQAIREHDEAVRRRGLRIWVGAEPTFTDPRSEAPEWLTEARGSEKEARARRLLASLYRELGGDLVLRSLGRQYTGERLARWSLGIYRRREGPPLWGGPPDPLIGGASCEPAALEVLWQGLARRLRAEGWAVLALRLEGALGLRLAFRPDGRAPIPGVLEDPRLARGSIHEQAVPPQGLADPLAEEGTYLVLIGCGAQGPEGAGGEVARVELPQFPDVSLFARFAELLGAAAREAALGGLVLTGFPPPTDASVAWTTVTPDPAVVEVNLAPAPDLETFLHWARTLYAAAAAQGLSPLRHHYNGDVADSGGGGQITLGGPSPGESPFFLAPSLLPNLIRYLNHHPALSYWLAPDSLGGSSQCPRADEGLRECFEELGLALERLEREPAADPQTLWRSLAPFLADPSGNTHRSELNVEKLWNPYLPARGCQGLVELRALRMAPTAEALAARAALFRAVAALLARAEELPPLRDWGAELHERFALPFYLRRDLEAVLAELEAGGLGLAPPLVAELLEPGRGRVGSADCGPCRLELERALEFWPLAGDVASQEHGTSRLLDASSVRLQLSLRPLSGRREDLEGWSVSVDGYRVPLREEQDGLGPVRLLGLRYRGFVPWKGLHPRLAAHGPLELELAREGEPGGWRVTLHLWRPAGGPYDGLPQSAEEAAHRRAERFVVERLEGGPPQPGRTPPPRSLTPFCFDLRYL